MLATIVAHKGKLLCVKRAQPFDVIKIQNGSAREIEKRKYVIYQQRGRVFHQGIQTPRN